MCYVFQIEKAQKDWMDNYLEYKGMKTYDEYVKDTQLGREEEFKEYLKEEIRQKYPLGRRGWINCESFIEAVRIVNAYDDDPVIMYDTEYGWSVYEDPYFTRTVTDGWILWIERWGSNRYRVHSCCQWGTDGLFYRRPEEGEYKWMNFEEVAEHAEQLDCEYLDWLEEDEEEEEN